MKASVQAMMPSAKVWLLLLLISPGLNALASTRAAAQSYSPLELIKGGGTPAAINGDAGVTSWATANSCRLLVNPSEAATQPLRIPPSDVASKNRLGCLSPDDAVYGSNGCPTKLCGSSSGVVPLK
jgi:hypothetical protein